MFILIHSSRLQDNRNKSRYPKMKIINHNTPCFRTQLFHFLFGNKLTAPQLFDLPEGKSFITNNVKQHSRIRKSKGG